jgi:hypothetical protein
MTRDLVIRCQRDRRVPTWPIGRLLGLSACVLILLCEPASANKFETIGGGVAGSRQFKLEWLQGFLYVVGGIGLLTAALAVFAPHNNPLFLNFANWKQSAVVASLIGVVCIGGALLL